MGGVVTALGRGAFSAYPMIRTSTSRRLSMPSVKERRRPSGDISRSSRGRVAAACKGGEGGDEEGAASDEGRELGLEARDLHRRRPTRLIVGLAWRGVMPSGRRLGREAGTPTHVARHRSDGKRRARPAGAVSPVFCCYAAGAPFACPTAPSGSASSVRRSSLGRGTRAPRAAPPYSSSSPSIGPVVRFLLGVA